ncbi:hypothetical protein ACFL0O_07405 [Thermodesulfobacteriota bacterium]
MFSTIRRVNIKNTLFLGAVLLCFGLVFLGVGSAAAPKVTIKPMITVVGRYDSNFYRTENNEREVYSYVIRPGIQVSAATAKTAISFSYKLSAYFYDEKGAVPLGLQPASEEDYVGHWASLDASYKATRRLTVGLKDSFYYTRRSDRFDDFYDDADRRKHYTNRLSPQLYYDFENRFSAGLRYQWQVVDYEDTDAGDAEEHRMAFDLLYNPSRTSTLTLNYQTWTQDYKVGGVDYTSNQIELIAQKRYKYFFFEVGGGYQDRSFENPGLEDRDLLVYRIAVGGQNPPSYNVGRRVYEEDSLRLRSHIYFDYERNFNDLDAFRTDDRFTLSVGHLFFEKIKAWLKVYHTISEYDAFFGPAVEGGTAQREDKTTGIAGAVRYKVANHSDLYLETGLTDRDSNIVGLSYDNVFVRFGLEFSHPIGRGKYGTRW